MFEDCDLLRLLADPEKVLVPFQVPLERLDLDPVWKGRSISCLLRSSR